MEKQSPNRRVTVKEVASSAGVAAITVSYVLSGRGDEKRISQTTQERVRDTARRLGYQKNGLAVALLQGRIHTVGLVLQVGLHEQGTESLHVYAKDVLAAVTWAAAQAGLRLTILLARGSDSLNAGELVDGRVDGLILASLRDEALSRAIYATGFPTVTLSSGYAERRVTIDNVGGARMATEHLLGLGHRRIAHVVLSGQQREGGLGPPINTSQERVHGYIEAMRAAGATPLICTVQEATAFLRGAPGERPTAFFCFSDEIACYLRRVAAQRNLRVPEDVSLVGFDDNILARNMMPPLTTVYNPIDAQVETAIEQLQALWAGETPPVPTPLPVRLVVRGSTAAPVSE